jgi:hypothetical protein
MAVNHQSGCWEVVGKAAHASGHVGFKDAGKPAEMAHRIVYRHFLGDPGDFCVLHRCDNPRCVNPDHLFLGTRTDNAADKVQKNRQAKGETANHKLREFQIHEIRRLIEAGERQHVIAKQYGVHQSAVSRIANGKRWSHACV